MFSQIGVTQVLLVLALVVVLFGRNKLPDVGRSLGRAIRNFKRSLDEPDEIDVTPPKKDAKPSDPK